MPHRRISGLLLLAMSLVGAIGAQQQPSAPNAIAVLRGHSETVEAVAISPDGTLVATGSFDRSAKIFDLASGTELRTFAGEQGHKGQVLAVAFNKKGEQVATGGADNFVKVWDVPVNFPSTNFATMSAVAGPAAGLHRAGEFLPEGARCAHRLKLAPLVPVKNLQHPNLVDCVAFDDTGNLLATGCHDGVLRIWDLAKGAAQKSINAHVQTTPQNVQSPIYAVLWTPDHKQVFTASFDKTVKLWDVAGGNLVREFKAAPGPMPIEPKKVEPKKEEKKDAKKVDPKLVAEFLGGLVRSDPPLPPGPPGHRDQVFSMALTKDGKFLATGSSDRIAQALGGCDGPRRPRVPEPRAQAGASRRDRALAPRLGAVRAAHSRRAVSRERGPGAARQILPGGVASRRREAPLRRRARLRPDPLAGNHPGRHEACARLCPHPWQARR